MRFLFVSGTNRFFLSRAADAAVVADVFHQLVDDVTHRLATLAVAVVLAVGVHECRHRQVSLAVAVVQQNLSNVIVIRD